MKEHKAVHVTKRDLRENLLLREYQLYANNVMTTIEHRYVRTRDASVQYDSKRDNVICTCRNYGGVRRHHEARYFSPSPKQIYAYHRSRSSTEIRDRVSNVKPYFKKKVKRVYLPETDDHGVSAEVVGKLPTMEISGFSRKTKYARGYTYYDHVRTSSKLVGGLNNVQCVVSAKLSPIIHTVSRSTSPLDSLCFRKDTNTGSNIVTQQFAHTTTQIGDPKPIREAKQTAMVTSKSHNAKKTTDTLISHDAIKANVDTPKVSRDNKPSLDSRNANSRNMSMDSKNTSAESKRTSLGSKKWSADSKRTNPENKRSSQVGKRSSQESKLKPILQLEIIKSTAKSGAKKDVARKGKEEFLQERSFSSDSVITKVTDFDNSSSIDNPSIENRLEKEFHNIFKDSNQGIGKPVQEKSTSLFKRRLMALKKSLGKNDSKQQTLTSSHGSATSVKDASVTSDPPSLEGRSFSNTEQIPKSSLYLRDSYKATPKYPPNLPLNWPQSGTIDSDYASGVKGMFKLWGKKFNLDDYEINEESFKERSSKRNEQATPDSFENKPDSIEKDKDIRTESTDAKKKERKSRKFSFFRRKKSKEKAMKEPYKQKKGVTTVRCEVKDGLNIKIGGNPTSDSPAPDKKNRGEKTPDNYEELLRAAWLMKFLTQPNESRKSVNVRWNNKTYATSSSTIFELMENVYKETTPYIFRSKSGTGTGSSSTGFKEYKRQSANFVQEIEAWMIHNTIVDKRPPLVLNTDSFPNNCENTSPHQKSVLDKSKAFADKIEVILHSNIVKTGQQESESSDYTYINIPQGFLSEDSQNTSCEERQGTLSSEEEVYKIVEYESRISVYKSNVIRVGTDSKDQMTKNIQVKINAKQDSFEKMIKHPPTHRDVNIQGSNVYIPKVCDVVGIGIITQRDLREKDTDALIIRVVEYLSEEDSKSTHTIQEPRNCNFAESFLHDYYQHCQPLNMDPFPVVHSDSHLICCSYESHVSRLGAGTESCPIFDDYTTFMWKRKVEKQKDEKKDKNKQEKDKKHKGDKNDTSLLCCATRTLPKDSLLVFKKRKIDEIEKTKWKMDEKPYSTPSNEDRGVQDSASRRGGSRRVFLSNCTPKRSSTSEKPSGVFKSSSKTGFTKNSIDNLYIDPEDCQSFPVFVPKIDSLQVSMEKRDVKPAAKDTDEADIPCSRSIEVVIPECLTPNIYIDFTEHDETKSPSEDKHSSDNDRFDCEEYESKEKHRPWNKKHEITRPWQRDNKDDCTCAPKPMKDYFWSMNQKDSNQAIQPPIQPVYAQASNKCNCSKCTINRSGNSSPSPDARHDIEVTIKCLPNPKTQQTMCQCPSKKHRKSKDRNTNDRKPKGRKPEDRKPEDRKPEDWKPIDRKPDDRKPKDQKPEDCMPEDQISVDSESRQRAVHKTKLSECACSSSSNSSDNEEEDCEPVETKSLPNCLPHKPLKITHKCKDFCKDVCQDKGTHKTKDKKQNKTKDKSFDKSLGRNPDKALTKSLDKVPFECFEPPIHTPEPEASNGSESCCEVHSSRLCCRGRECCQHKVVNYSQLSQTETDCKEQSILCLLNIDEPSKIPECQKETDKTNSDSLNPFRNTPGADLNMPPQRCPNDKPQPSGMPCTPLELPLITKECKNPECTQNFKPVQKLDCSVHPIKCTPKTSGDNKDCPQIPAISLSPRPQSTEISATKCIECAPPKFPLNLISCEKKYEFCPPGCPSRPKEKETKTPPKAKICNDLVRVLPEESERPPAPNECSGRDVIPGIHLRMYPNPDPPPQPPPPPPPPEPPKKKLKCGEEIKKLVEEGKLNEEKLQSHIGACTNIREDCEVYQQAVIEQKNYTNLEDTAKLIDNIYDSKINRAERPLLAATERMRQVQKSKSDSNTSIANVIEINFKLRVSPGDKNTEINVSDNPIDVGKNTGNKNQKEVFVVKNEKEVSTEENSPQNDLNIRIMIKNFRSKSETKKRKPTVNEFSKKISNKFSTISTGYSTDIKANQVEDKSVHRATVDLTTSDEKLSMFLEHPRLVSETTSVRSDTKLIEAATAPETFEVNLSAQKIPEATPKVSSQLVSSTDITASDNLDAKKIPSDNLDTEKTVSNTLAPEKAVSENLSKTSKKVEVKGIYRSHHVVSTTDTDGQDNSMNNTTSEEPMDLANKTSDDQTSEKINEGDTDMKSSFEIEKIPSYEINRISYTRKEEKKSLLKQVFEKFDLKKPKTRSRIQKFKDMLKGIMTSDSEPDDATTDKNKAALEQLAGKYMKITNIKTFSQIQSNIMPGYTIDDVSCACSETDSDSESDGGEGNTKKPGGCMCNIFTQRLNVAGCCCNKVSFQDQEINCNLMNDEELAMLCQDSDESVTYADGNTQNSIKSSSHLSSLSSQKSFSASKINVAQESRNKITEVISVKSTKSTKILLPHSSRIQERELRVLNARTRLGISSEDKVIVLESKSTRITEGSTKNSKKNLTGANVLQLYETKKAVLEIYAEKTITEDGEHIVARLPKFVSERENEYDNYENEHSHSYKAVRKNYVMMAVGR